MSRHSPPIMIALGLFLAGFVVGCLVGEWIVEALS